MDSHPPGSDRAASAETCERIRKHLEQGAPWDACDAFREEIARRTGDADLLYWGALAHARSGASKTAHALLDQAEAAGSMAPGQSGRYPEPARAPVEGRLSARARPARERRAMAERARRRVSGRLWLQHDVYPGINAATLSLLLGDRPAALSWRSRSSRGSPRRSAAHVLGRCDAGRGAARARPIRPGRQSYASAYAQSAGDAGSVATMRRQLQLLARVASRSDHRVARVLPAPAVVAFAGHMIDAPTGDCRGSRRRWSRRPDGGPRPCLRG